MEVFKGYVIERYFTLHELLAFVHPYLQQVRTSASQAASSLAAGIAVDVIDHMTLYPSAEALMLLQSRYGRKMKLSDNPISFAYDVMLEKENAVKTFGKRDPKFDLLCKLHFHPLEDKTLCWLDAQQDSYIALWRDMPGVKPYPYFPCDTPPDGLTTDEWLQRLAEWRSIFPKARDASPAAITVECIPSFPDFDWELIMNAIKPLEKRIRSKAKDNILARRHRELKQGDDDRIDWGLGIDIMEWMLSDPEGQAAVDREVERITHRFKANLSRSDLLLPLSEFGHTDTVKEDTHGQSRVIH